jgi:L-2-hydroxyglutarate oxidase LhgO
MGKVLPEYLSLWTTNMVQKEGVNVITNAEVKDVEKVKDQLVLSLNNGSKVILVQTFLIKHWLIVLSARKSKPLLNLRFPQH